MDRKTDHQLSLNWLLFSLIMLGSLGETVAYSRPQTIPAEQNDWRGFGADFDPQWWGQTRQVDWSRYSGSNGITISAGGIRDPFYWGSMNGNEPIQLQSVSRSTSVDNKVKIYVPSAKGEADFDDHQRNRLAGSWSSQLARYAEVIDLDEFVLGNGSAIAEQTSNVANGSFSLSGRISTQAKLDSVVGGSSQVSSESNTFFEATYAVHDSRAFDFSGILSGAGEIGLDLKILDADSGKALQALSIKDFIVTGKSHQFALNGQIDPGNYTFSFSAKSFGSINGWGNIDRSGFGEFSLDFSTAPLGESPTVAKAGQSFALLQGSHLIPEPSSFSLFLCGLLATLSSRLRSTVLRNG